MNSNEIIRKVLAKFKKAKSYLNTNKAPIALHAVNQSLVTHLWEELQKTKKDKSPGEFGKRNRVPICFVALDQQLVETLWKEIQENLKK